MNRSLRPWRAGSAPAPGGRRGLPSFSAARSGGGRPKLAAGQRALLPRGCRPRGGGRLAARGVRAVRERFRSRELLRVAEPVAAVARGRRRFLLEVGVAREPLVE